MKLCQLTSTQRLLWY